MKKTISFVLALLTVLGVFSALSVSSAGPAKVGNVRQTYSARKSVKIKWDAVEGSGVTYELKLSDSKTTKTYNNIKTNSLRVSGLSEASSYYAEVRAVNGDTHGKWSDKIKAATCCGDTTAKQTKAHKNAVTLSWSKVNGASGYNIYAKSSTAAGNTYKLLTYVKDALKAKVKLKSDDFTSDFLALIVSPVRAVKGYKAENNLSVLSDSCTVNCPKIIPPKANIPTYSSGKLHFSVNSWLSGVKYAVYELGGSKVISTNISAKDKSKASVKFSPKAGVLYKVHARGYVNVNGNVSYGDASDIGYASKAPTVSFSWKNGSLKTSWSKLDGATGYNVSLTNVADSGDTVKVKNVQTESYTFKTSDLKGLNVNKSYKITAKPYRNMTGLTSGTANTFRVEIIGHRGCMDEAPENTMASYERAYINGYDTTEADFWETNSGDIIISHSQMLEQCGCPDTDVRTVSKATIKNYPIIKGSHVKDYPTQYLPTLGQLVKKVASYKMKLLLHMKDVKMSDAGLQKVYDILARYEMLDKTVVLSSSIEGVKRIVNVKLAASFLYVPNSVDDIKRCIDFSARNRIGMMIFKYNEFLSKKYTDYARKNSVRVGCYNVNDKKTACKMSNIQADFLITNNNYFTRDEN